MRSHHHQQHGIPVTVVPHPMRFAGRSDTTLTRFKPVGLLCDNRRRISFQNKIDLVLLLVRVDLLFLPGLQTVEIGKELRRLVQIDLGHLFVGETDQGSVVGMCMVGLWFGC